MLWSSWSLSGAWLALWPLSVLWKRTLCHVKHKTANRYETRLAVWRSFMMMMIPVTFVPDYNYLCFFCTKNLIKTFMWYPGNERIRHFNAYLTRLFLFFIFHPDLCIPFLISEYKPQIGFKGQGLQELSILPQGIETAFPFWAKEEGGDTSLFGCGTGDIQELVSVGGARSKDCDAPLKDLCGTAPADHGLTDC